MRALWRAVREAEEQWMLAITKYADLARGLDTIGLPPKIRKQREDWIGKRGRKYNSSLRE